MTREEQIRKSLTTRELAEILIREYNKHVYDYVDGEPYECFIKPCFMTSDGREFWSYSKSVEHEIEWLKQKGENI